MAAAAPPAAARGSNAHFSDLLRALWAPGPRWPSALVIWPILLKVELIERIDLLRLGRHRPDNYLTFAAVTYETSGASALCSPLDVSELRRHLFRKRKIGVGAALRGELCRCVALCL